MTLPQKRAELKQPREPLLVVLPHPVVLTPELGQAHDVNSNARTRSWAEVAAGVPVSGLALTKRPRRSLQPSGNEGVEVVEELASVLEGEKGESEHFEGILAAALA